MYYKFQYLSEVVSKYVRIMFCARDKISFQVFTSSNNLSSCIVMARFKAGNLAKHYDVSAQPSPLSHDKGQGPGTMQPV